MITLEIAAPEFVKRYQAGEIPDSARVTVTYQPEENASASPSDVAWDEEGALAGAELETERRLYEQFEQGVNANRSAAQMRVL